MVMITVRVALETAGGTQLAELLLVVLVSKHLLAMPGDRTEPLRFILTAKEF